MMANNELEVVWSNRPWYNLRHNPDISMEELRKSTKKSWLLGVQASIRTGHFPSKYLASYKDNVISDVTNVYLLLTVQFVGLNIV